MAALDIIFLGILIAVLVPIALIDLRERRIPNWLNLALAVAGLLRIAVIHGQLWAIGRSVLESVVAGVLLVGACLLIKLIDKRAHIGWGDIKFLFASAFWVGLVGSVLVLLLASVTTVVAALVMMPWRKMSLRQTVPFGPMLAFGLLVVFTASAIVQHGQAG